MKRYFEMDVDEYRDTMEDLAWEEAQESEDLDAQELIDKQVERPRDRLRLIMIVGDYLNLSHDEAFTRPRIEKRAKELGVTVEDLVAWFLAE